MARETFQNFATSTLSASLTNSALSFSLTTGGGALFPTTNFTVTIDTEILLISSRSGDAFTVASGGRGYDGSTAASHSSPAPVQASVTAYTMNHLWQNTPDTYTADVPPVQASLSSAGVPNGTAGTYDTEFESAGSWTLFPSPASGTTLAIGSSMRSHLLFNRGGSDTSLYTAYIGFTPGGSWTLTCKVSDATNFIVNFGQNSQLHFFVSDLSNPTASADSGNRFRMDIISQISTTSHFETTNWRYARAWKDVAGTGSQIDPAVAIPIGMPLYFRITYDGTSFYGYLGDGFTYTQIAGVALSMTPRSMGFQYYSGNSTGSYILHTVAVDWVRYASSILSPWGQ